MKLGVIGVGSMGGAIVRRLLELGYAVYVWDVNVERIKKCAELGATPASSSQELLEKTKTIIACLPSPQAVQEVFLDKKLLESIQVGTVVIDFSTVDPETSRKIYETLKPKGVEYLDAPVSGGPRRAASGKLTITVGGDLDAFKKCEPLLHQLGEKVFYLGGSGSGSIFKLINQLLVFAHTYVAMEALVLCRTLGLDPQKMYNVVINSSGNSFIFQEMVKMTISGEMWGGGTYLLIKDINLVYNMAVKAGVNLKMCKFLKEIADKMIDNGYSNDDAVKDFHGFVSNIAISDDNKN